MNYFKIAWHVGEISARKIEAIVSKVTYYLLENFTSLLLASILMGMQAGVFLNSFLLNTFAAGTGNNFGSLALLFIAFTTLRIKIIPAAIAIPSRNYERSAEGLSLQVKGIAQ